MQISSRWKTIWTLLACAPLLVLLTSCGGEVKLDKSGKTLAERSVTEGGRVPVYPDDAPSVPDGKVVWVKENCAQCHGETGTGGSVKEVDLTNPNWERQQKPIDQYMFLTFGKEGVTHPALKDKLTNREIWDLTFYTRSLASPLLSKDEWFAVDPVFGSNCVVCHGKKGNGDGPLAHTLEPVPANFAQFNRFYDRTDAILWDHIANGIKWEGMPNFKGKQDRLKKVVFDDAYIWKLVQYVRAFHETNRATIAESPEPAKTSESAHKAPN